MAQSKEGREVILGVDTHLDAHVAVVIDGVGKVLGTLIAPVGLHGYQQLLQWSRSFGACTRAGVEGTGTYGAGLARVLRDAGIEVLEVNRADRSKRRLRGKSDPRRTAEGRSSKEIQRCLKRYIVRELYPLILADLRDAVASS